MDALKKELLEPWSQRSGEGSSLEQDCFIWQIWPLTTVLLSRLDQPTQKTKGKAKLF